MHSEEMEELKERLRITVRKHASKTMVRMHLADVSKVPAESNVFITQMQSLVSVSGNPVEANVVGKQ